MASTTIARAPLIQTTIRQALSAAAVAVDVPVSLVGRAPKVRERFYAISLEENPTHPAVAAICKPHAISARRRNA